MSRISLLFLFFFLFIKVDSFLGSSIPLENRIISVKKIKEISKIKRKEIVVKASMYHLDEKQCDNTPFLTASGLILRENDLKKNNYISISRNLHKRYGGVFNFFDTVLVRNAKQNSNKKYIIVDLMHERWINKIDFLEPSFTKNYFYRGVVLVLE